MFYVKLEWRKNQSVMQAKRFKFRTRHCAKNFFVHKVNTCDIF